MEQFCGTLKPAIKSRRHPYRSLDRFALATAQLKRIKLIYNVSEELSLEALKTHVKDGIRNLALSYCELFAISCLVDPLNDEDTDPAHVLFPHVSREFVDTDQLSAICSTLATKFGMANDVIRRFRHEIIIEQWGRVRRADFETGETMRASEVGKVSDDSRDATFVKVSLISIVLASNNCPISV